MIVDQRSLDLVFKGFKTVYTDAYLKAEVHWDKIAMQVSSGGSDETYGWLGMFPNMRQWLGPRVVRNLSVHKFTIENLDFESTVSVPRNAIMDDKLGAFKPTFAELGHTTRQHPEELIFTLLNGGFDTICYDGQNFFDENHPVGGELEQTTLVSNMQAGTGPAWFLLDTSREVRPIVWQERKPYEFVTKTRPEDDNVFFDREFLYGIDARVNAGFGLWQLAYGSKAALTKEAYAAARAAMMNFKSAEGRILGVKPTVMVVPPELEDAALHILNADFNEAGGSNPWSGTAELIVSPYLSAT
ncbi:MAG: Mu-like prophage major head subunit gpT family protein [Pseudomonadota bacterium]